MGKTLKSQYTPGPWKVSSEELGLSVVCAKGVDFEIATLAQRRPEAENNAALIAAAPDLLEALEQLMDAYRKDIDPGPSFDNAGAAIRKARGE